MKLLAYFYLSLSCMFIYGCGGGGSGGGSDDSSEGDISNFSYSNGFYQESLTTVGLDIELDENFPYSDALLLEMRIRLSSDAISDDVVMYMEVDPEGGGFTSQDTYVDYPDNGMFASLTESGQSGIKLNNRSGVVNLGWQYRGYFFGAGSTVFGSFGLLDEFMSGNFYYAVELFYYSDRNKTSLLSYDRYPNGSGYVHVDSEQVEPVNDYEGENSYADIRNIDFFYDLAYE